MSARHVATLPCTLYGTAWKEARTEALTAQALELGYRAIDTANQRKHYVEADVGRAVKKSGIARAELFLQSKFTYVRGQDQRLPYDPSAPIGQQVRQSLHSSLEHLGSDHLDAYLLHGPWGQGWSGYDREAWAALETLLDEGRVRSIGVSNVSLAQLRSLCAQERLAPAFVQNRCYARRGWDRALRAFCAERGIVYQGFSLLTANAAELAAPEVEAAAQRRGVSVAQLVFAFARGVGMLPLTGTTSRTHMRDDLASEQLTLTAAELALLERLGD